MRSGCSPTGRPPRSVLRNDPATATKALETGLRSATGDVRSQSLAMAANAAAMRGDPSAELLGEARSTALELDDPGTTLMTLQATALIGLIEGDLGEAAEAAAVGVRIARQTGDLYSLTMMLMNQGYAALRQDDKAPARAAPLEGLRLARDLDDRVAQAHLVTEGLSNQAIAAAAPVRAHGREPRPEHPDQARLHDAYADRRMVHGALTTGTVVAAQAVLAVAQSCGTISPLAFQTNWRR